MTKLRLASAARPALMLVVEGPPWTSSALVSGPNSQNCAREVRLAVVLSYRSLSLVLVNPAWRNSGNVISTKSENFDYPGTSQFIYSIARTMMAIPFV